MYNFLKKNIFLVFIISVALMYLLFIGATPLFDRDEGYYVSVVMNMLNNHNYLLPIYNNEYWLEKPILLYWLIQTSTLLLGKSIFAFRLPAACCGVLLILSMNFLLRKIIKDKTLSLIICASIAFMPLLIVISRTTMIDIPLVLSTTLTLLCFFIATERDKSCDRKWYYFSWFFLGLSFLAKGPVGVAIILPAMFIYLLIQRRFWHVFFRANIPVGILIFCFVNFWYFIVFWKLGYKFWNDFFIQQIFNRSSKSLVGGTAIFANLGGAFFYIATILLTTIPFIAPAVSGFLLALNKGLESRESTWDKLALLSAVFSIITIIIFSLSATKLPYYILPIYPFLGILVGYFWLNVKTSNNFFIPYKSVFWTIFYLSSLLIIVVSFVAPFAIYFGWDSISNAVSQDFNPTEYALPATLPNYLWILFLLGIVSILVIFLFKYFYRRKNINFMILTTIVGGFLYSLLAILIFFISISWLQTPAINMATELKSKLTKNSVVSELAIMKPSLHYYLNTDKINDYAFATEYAKSNKAQGIENYTIINNLNELDAKVSNKYPHYLITRDGLDIDYKSKNISVIKNLHPYIILGNNKAKQQWKNHNS
ncbi:ArnT family glycosyltransferase [Allofrancisella frigidaquae]|uniref:Phospholipid carrier-dependent glycosyltransferase n=1 Tax=Allofrancisella frigidaquae TaxID=1085644 RepID=A0A6M3HUM2_9GAMM|nr:glycosyltransferase family 39 protein [Allofrancisella frigidaquae]QIV94807.1 phospholipid carrier-dependent glycosyltransferase [Allofrancisella frigidaquae]